MQRQDFVMQAGENDNVLAWGTWQDTQSQRVYSMSRWKSSPNVFITCPWKDGSDSKLDFTSMWKATAAC